MSTEYASMQEITELNQNEGQPTETPQDDTSAQPEGQEQKAESNETMGGDPNWNPKEWQLKFRDQTIVPKDRNHLVSLAQQGYSYSQRMSEVKQKESELNQRAAQYDQYKQLEEAFEKNPEFRQKIMEWYQSSLTPGMPKSQEADATPAQSNIPPELLKEIQELKGWKEEFTQHQQQQLEAKADQEVMTEIETLKGKYQRDDWETPNVNGDTLLKEIVKHAYDMGGVKLEVAYRDLMWDSHTKDAQVNGMKTATEAQIAAKKAGTVAGGRGRGASAVPQVNTAGMDYRDIEKLVNQEYGITN